MEEIMNENNMENNDDFPDDGLTCPKCGSHRVEFGGLIASGELRTYKCKDCGAYWEEVA